MVAINTRFLPVPSKPAHCPTLSQSVIDPVISPEMLAQVMRWQAQHAALLVKAAGKAAK